MLNLPAMPLKLECKRCKKLYLHQAIANHSGRTASEVNTAKKLLGIQ